MTPLDKTLRRSLIIRNVEFVVTLTPEGLKLTQKGRRIGMELKWADLTSGESALAVALSASIGKFNTGTDQQPAKKELPQAKAAVKPTRRPRPSGKPRPLRRRR